MCLILFKENVEFLLKCVMLFFNFFFLFEFYRILIEIIVLMVFLKNKLWFIIGKRTEFIGV